MTLSPEIQLMQPGPTGPEPTDVYEQLALEASRLGLAHVEAFQAQARRQRDALLPAAVA